MFLKIAPQNRCRKFSFVPVTSFRDQLWSKKKWLSSSISLHTMNEINTTCQTSAVGVIYLTYGQLASLTIANCIVSASSLSEILIAFFVQNLHLVLIYDKTCSVTIASQFLSTFLLRLFGYTIGIIGVDRYIRIKYKMRFKSILTAKFMMSMKVLVWMTAFLHAVWITVGLVENHSRNECTTNCIYTSNSHTRN